jgi:error-prone DNA polymerase
VAEYAELHCHSNFSFLDGASHPAELAARAGQLGLRALAITDTGGVYGAVRHARACKAAGVHAVIGACLEVDGHDLVLLARSRQGYSNLCRLLSLAHREQPKGEARTTLAALAAQRTGLYCLTDTDDEAWLTGVRDALSRDAVFVELHNHLRPEDPWVLADRVALAGRLGLETVATNHVRFHDRERRPLHDVLTAIRRRTTLEEVRDLLPSNSEQVLKGPDEMAELFAGHAGAVERAVDLAMSCQVDLDFGDVRFPGYAVPEGESPFSYLYDLAYRGARERYRPFSSDVAERLFHELRVIERTNLAEFFLINWDLVEFARRNHVPCQGRGSAADSIIAYVLGITRVDPIEHNLLFERFLHEGMKTMPDIDIDFSTAHREQVIQYIYDRYGWERTGMVCNVVTFRPRMAIRQVGKALGFPPDLIDRLAKGVDRWFADARETNEDIAAQAPDRMESGLWRWFLRLVEEVQGFPRHLSIHVGGMLVTGRPLVEIVPVEPARMPGRVVVQFNKDDVEDLGLIKMDMLGLRTLSVVAETLELVERATGERPDLDALPLDDPEVYAMCSAADTIGVFQIESRAQMMTLPRTEPSEFNDLVVEVAIIRPGPIQGGAVHPYIRRKRGAEEVVYDHPLLEPILKDTLGVILYQEQILQIAIDVAGMPPSSADRFRRAMTRDLPPGELEGLTRDFVAGCMERGVPQVVADKVFASVRGFAVYGFCRSHAAAFARTSYETAWLKLRFPAEFTCGLLNNQPMGFYHPSVLVEDAKRHGLTVLPVDVNASAERCLPFPGVPAESRWRGADSVGWVGSGHDTLRVGFNYVRDLGEPGREAIVAERERAGAYRSFDDFVERLRGAPVGARAVRNLVMVGAFDAYETPRRELLWAWQERWDGASPRRRVPAQSELRLPAGAPSLPGLTELETTRLEYRISSLSTGRHIIHFYRDRLRALGALRSSEAVAQPAGRTIRVAGLVIVRQAPSTANRIRFFTLEDEHGHVNVTIKPDVYERFRRACAQPVLVIDGVVQKADGVWSLLAAAITPMDTARDDAGRSHDYR